MGAIEEDQTFNVHSVSKIVINVSRIAFSVSLLIAL